MSLAAAPRACRRCGQSMALENSCIERGVLFRRWACACGEGALDRHPAGRRLVETVLTEDAAAADAVLERSLSDDEKERLKAVLEARRARPRSWPAEDEYLDDDEDDDEDDEDDLDDEAPRPVVSKEETMEKTYACDKCDAVFNGPRELGGHMAAKHAVSRARPCGCARVGQHKGTCPLRIVPAASGAILPTGIASGATPATEPTSAPAPLPAPLPASKTDNDLADPFALLLEGLESAARRVRDDPSPRTIRECEILLAAIGDVEHGRREAGETAES